MKITVAWLSAGVSSFIAAYLIKDEIDEFYYIDIADQHPDSMRFIKDCEKLLGKQIKPLKSTQYDSVEEACCAGGMGYWNKIRVDFPEVFKVRAELERKLNCRCLKECFLDELDPNRGNIEDEIMEDCGIFCEINLNK